MHRVINERIEDFVSEYNGSKFHALLCDPPYELGFMGKNWDRSGIAFHPDTWAALAEHMFPGAFGVAFASARGWHRLACAIEDAGLRIHPSIFGWVYGSGFPKATRIDTQIDSAAGIKIKHGTLISENLAMSGGNYSRDNKHVPVTALAKTWSGYRYGLQALKPALEPIIVFQVPYKGKSIDSIVETGAGAFNIDGARIPHNEECRLMAAQTDRDAMSGYGKVRQGGRYEPTLELKPEGRWPANFYVDEEAAKRLGEQSGISRSVANRTSDHRKTAFYRAGGDATDGYSGERNPYNSHSDTGTAARFFLNVDWALEESDPVLYCPKAGRKERDAGLADISPGNNKVRNPHPTVKPIKLTRWLATLLLPPEEYAPRRILVPFAGSGSEMIGAVMAGWDEVIGIEMDPEYCRIAEARLKHWVNYQLRLL